MVYPASDFLATDQLSFSISDSAPSLNNYFTAANQDFSNSYVSYQNGQYSSGNSSTTVSGTDLTRDGLHLVYSNGEVSGSLTVSVQCASAAVSPTVTVVGVPENASYAIGATLEFTVEFSSAVSVTGTPQLGLTIGSATRQASYSSGSGTTDLKFRYLVAAGDLAPSGMEISALSFNSGTITNGGMTADLTLNSVASTSGILVDGVRPAVSSITLNGNPAPNAGTLRFAVAFSEPVTGVDTSAFQLTTTGSVVSSISDVTTSGQDATVTVGVTSGSGTVRLDLVSGAALKDGAGNAPGAGYTSGVVHTVQQVPGAPTVGTATAGNQQASVAFTAPASNGGATITGYTVTSNPGSITATGSASPVTVSGLANGTAYTFYVTATNSVGAGVASAASNSVTPKGTQTITFSNPGTRNFDTSPTLTASSSSTLAVTFTSSTAGICTISSGGVLTFISTGTCTIDADQTGDGVYLAAPTVSQSFSVSAVVPTAPVIGSATAGDEQATISFTAPASNGGAPITGYTVTSSPGNVTATGAASPITVTGLSNGTAYTFTVTASNSMGAGTASAATAAVTPAAALTKPVAGLASATVAANSSANPITLAISGGTPASVAVASAASHGTATASGTAITYTPAAGYSGGDSFTYTATNPAGTSSPATVSITVTAPTFTFAPVAGALTAGTAGTAYSTTIVASGGGISYTYAVTAGSLPAGLSLATDGTISGTPTADENASFTITATDTHGATGTVSYSLAIGPQAPFANGVSATVAANSSANPITLDITGGAAVSVAVDLTGTRGTATVSGTAVTYTPLAGYSGTDSFTYTATNSAGTSSPATVTITVTAPTFTFAPAAGALTTGTVGIAYSKTIAASGGGAPYDYAITAGSLPSGLSLATDGTISGAPTADENSSFTITATDSNGTTGTAIYSLQVNAAGSASFVFTPAAGALPEAMAGEDYSQAISTTGGTAPLIYSLSTGTLPPGLILNISTGALSGPLHANTEGDYSFTIQVEDSHHATATAAYTLKVKAQDISVTDKVVNVPAGSSPPDVYLNRGATGGPFTSADITFVEPANAGSTAIIQGQLAQAGSFAPVGWYLQFTPNPAYSGQVRVGFRLTSSLGNSNTGTVTYNLNYAAGQVAESIDHLVHDFVQSRQNMISSSIKVPGLLERRQMGQESNPVTARMMPSENGLTVGFSTSLAQMEAAGSTPVDGKNADLSPFNIWIDGAFLTHRDSATDDGKWGSFAMINLGADYLLSDKALLGFSLHYDRMTDPTDADAELTGNGWLAGPYASFEIGKNVFWNTSLLYGGSSNDIDTDFWDGTFDTTRWMADTSIEGQWAIDDDTILTPKLRAVYFSEKVEDYAVSNSTGDMIAIDGFDEEQFRLSLGAEIARSFTVESGSVLTPKLGLTAGFSGLDGSGAFGLLTAGLSIQTVDLWMIDASLLLNVEGDGETSAGARVGAAKRF